MNPDNGRISEMDVYLIKEGNHSRLWEVLGSHPCVVDDQNGTHFAVWAPNAESVSVIGDFNDWDGGTDPLMVRWDESGIWEGFVPGIGKGDLYKYLIRSKRGGGEFRKTDPMAFHNEMPPRTASKIWDLDHRWDDGAWMKNRTGSGTLREPMSVYEVHLGSWRMEDGSLTGIWPDRLPTTWTGPVLPTLSSFRSWSIRSTAPGVIR